jgi:bifunctional non-homologous end joining protein LigD
VTGTGNRGRPGGRRGPAAERGLPEDLRPMLATAGRLPFEDTGWAYEMKWDGIRAIGYAEAGRLRLVSRTGRDISSTYPELAGLAEAVQQAGASSAVLDGEIVAFGAGGWPSFEAIQQRMNISAAQDVRILARQVPVTYLAFDLLGLNGHALLDLPYGERRGLLDELGLNGGHWQTPPSFTGEAGADVLAMSQQQHMEGVVAKRLASRYEPGRRTASWIKVKNIRRQEAVVGGWQPGERGRSGQIGSLLIGVQTPDGLAYAGHVGTGFTQQTLRLLAGRLAPLRRATSPFVTQVPPEHARSAVWVEPELVVEVAFTEWTSAGRLRAPAYKGLRDDRDPAEVVREDLAAQDGAAGD